MRPLSSLTKELVPDDHGLRSAGVKFEQRTFTIPSGVSKRYTKKLRRIQGSSGLTIPRFQIPSRICSHGRQFLARIDGSEIRVLAPLKTHPEAELIHTISVESQSFLLDVVWKFGEMGVSTQVSFLSFDCDPVLRGSLPIILRLLQSGTKWTVLKTLFQKKKCQCSMQGDKCICDSFLMKEKCQCFNMRQFSDEAHFWLNGYVNKQNCRIWSEANPQVYVETPLHPEKLTVWCALWAGGIIGLVTSLLRTSTSRGVGFFVDPTPTRASCTIRYRYSFKRYSSYFFKNDEGHNVTVNGDRYRAMITNFFIPELNNHDVQELWFQQDGATCHTARATIDLLKDTFGDRLISRFGPVNWPPRSCDLTPLDYFL
ncbi:hypothetical protein TNCV_1667061 [Trichonephila clavipes]|nr:hypothetical protein TNCV_1667061 [Trichonephila clavipes]